MVTHPYRSKMATSYSHLICLSMMRCTTSLYLRWWLNLLYIILLGLLLVSYIFLCIRFMCKMFISIYRTLSSHKLCCLACRSANYRLSCQQEAVVPACVAFCIYITRQGRQLDSRSPFQDYYCYVTFAI